MATSADSNNTPTTPAQHALISMAYSLLVGLAWGAVMLVVFGFWMRSKYQGRAPIVSMIFFIAGAATAALAFWQAFTLWFKKETPEEKSATLQQQSRIFSFAFLGAGIGLVLIAFVLGFDKGAGGNYNFNKDNFAETFGAILFGLIALGGGYFLQQPEGSTVSPIQFLLDKVPVLKLIQIVIGATCLVSFGYLAYKNQGDFMGFFPELLALLCMSMLCLGCLLWLNNGQFDEFGIRLFVLVFGGSTGVILFFMILCRAYLWRQDIFLGGTVAWQGPNAWHFWLCAYVLFISLVLMFVSFNLARADIRKNVALRRVMYGYDALVQAMLLIGILTITNIVIYALVPGTYDWTQSRGAYDLAVSSKNLIAGLKEKTHVIVFMRQNNPLYKDVRNLLDNCEALSNKERLEVKYVSPDLQQVEYAGWANKFPAIRPLQGQQGGGVLVVYGVIPEKLKDEDPRPPHAFVAESRLFEIDRQAPKQPGEKESIKYSFKGEAEILKELKFLAEGRNKRKVYVLQGNGEADMNGKLDAPRQDFRTPFTDVGINMLVGALGDDNYEVKGLSFGEPKPGQKDIEFAKEAGADKRKDIPDDCQTLIIAGVTKSLDPKVLDAVERYMDHRNGKLLVFLDVVADSAYSKLENSGLENFLKNYGVEVKDEFLLRIPARGEYRDHLAVFAKPPRDTENVLGRQFSGNSILMKRSARVVKPAASPGKKGFKAETLLQVETASQRIFVEKDVKILNDLLDYVTGLEASSKKRAERAAESPVSVAVAVSLTEDDGKKTTPRMVVFGDTEMITNFDLVPINYDMTLSALDWMAERESLGARPKDHRRFKLDAEVDYWRMVMVPGWLMSLSIIAMGIAIWVVRRR